VADFSGSLTVPTLFSVLAHIQASATSSVEGPILHFGAPSYRRSMVFNELRDRGAELAVVSDLYDENNLSAAIRKSIVVISPMFYSGYVFACFMRIAQAISHGVVVVSETGWLSHDTLEQLAACLGGVYFVPYDRLVTMTMQIVRSNRTRLTDDHVKRWNAFRQRLLDWDGTLSHLRHVTLCKHEREPAEMTAA
jgi:hypothetical protein